MGDTCADPSKILQLGMGFWASRTLLSAVELGVHPALLGGPLNGVELAQRIGLHPRGAADFLDALVALGMLYRQGDGGEALYANTSETATFLDPAAPAYVGGILLMAARRLYPAWGHLTDSLRSGDMHNEAAAGEDVFAKLYEDPARLEGFLSAMASVNTGNFVALAERFDFSRYGTLCDVGGASGALSIVVARGFPALRCVSFDLPQATPVAQRKIEAAGLGAQVQARSGNFMTDPLPHADVITMGNILHDWGLEVKLQLIAKAYEALPQGGAFIAIENIIDDARRTNAFGLLMSLNMLIETAEGYDYTFAQFDGWCRAAGFRNTEKIPLAGAASAAVAWK